jgi:large subunit ribosomal protein L24
MGMNSKEAEKIPEKYKLRKNDIVKILKGKNKGNTGRILQINAFDHTVLIEGQNMVKKAMRKKKQTDKGGISEIEAPISISNVMIICKKCGKPTRILIKTDNDKKIRVCKHQKCGEEL